MKWAWISISWRSRKDKMLKQILDAGLHAPKTLTLSITNKCNLNCRHCWPESGSESISGPVAKEVLFKLIDQSGQLGIEKIVIAGGESLTHPHWFEVLCHCCGQKTIRSVCLQTNATLVSKVTVEKLLSLRCADLSIQASLDGATAETHDMVRGKGSFVRALAGLQRLVSAGLGPITFVAFTEMRHNFDEISLLLDLVEDLGISRLVTGTLIRGGRAARNSHLSLPKISQYENLLDRYQSDPVFRTKYEKLGNIAALEWFRGKESQGRKACSCIENPYITADGRIYPCTLFQADEYAVRGVHKRALNDVLASALPLWSLIPEMNRRRSMELSTCRDCPGKAHCDGGCIGRAHAAYGTILAVEDRCALRRAVYAYRHARDSLP
jgi:radical SAM protein with 4Fe4S-binding SPASM domain